jgi:prepilin-type N-terminal cleavage/methylation domain-containing protein
VSRATPRAGFTLIELMIAITLVSAILAGMLVSLRGGLLALERTDARILESRAALGLDQMIRRQLGGVFPAVGDCALSEGLVSRVPVFRGNAQAMLLVTSYSMAEGARGYPRLAEYRVIANNDGTVRLAMEELLFPSPETALPYCSSNSIRPVTSPGQVMVVAPRLAAARFSYREVDPYTRLGGKWVPEWIAPNLPYGIRIDMQATAEDGGGFSNITVPLHVSREYRESYADRR